VTDFINAGADYFMVGAYYDANNPGRWNMLEYDTGNEEYFDTGNNGDILGSTIAKDGGVINTGDSYEELVVGLPGYRGGDNDGAVYVYYGEASTSNSDIGSCDVCIYGYGLGAGNEELGYSVAVGDFNGDSSNDILVGAPYNDNGGTNIGQAYIYNGPFTTGASPYAQPDIILLGQSSGEQFGWSVASSNLNGGSYDEALIGAPYNDEGGTDIGRAYIFYGGSPMDATVDVDIVGQQAGEAFGFSVATGDFNGGGQDVLIGAPQWSGTNPLYFGRAYIFYGTTWSSTESTPDVTLQRRTVSTLDEEQFGYSVAAINYNSDGFDDALIGAPYKDVGASPDDDGAVYVFAGSATMGTDFAVTGDVDDCDSSTLTEGNVISGDHTSTHVSDNTYHQIRETTNGAGPKKYTVEIYYTFTFTSVPTGSFNVFIEGYYSDASAETLSIYAWDYDTGPQWVDTGTNMPATEGMTSLTLGNQYASAGGEVRIMYFDDDDGESDSLGNLFIDYQEVSWYSTSAPSQSCTNRAAGERFGFSVASGDFDGDSSYRDDALIGAPGYSTDDGRAYVCYNIDTTPAYENLPGLATDEQSGYAVAAGDHNNDGYDDAVVGAPYYDGASTNDGRTFVFYGASPISNMANTPDLTYGAETNGEMNGFSLAVGNVVAGLRVLYDEVIVGAPLRNTDDGRAYIYAIPEFSDIVIPIAVIIPVAIIYRRIRNSNSKKN
jgi:hypothetical protein